MVAEDAELLGYVLGQFGAQEVTTTPSRGGVVLSCVLDNSAVRRLLAQIEDAWERGFRHAVEYFEEHGDLHVDTRYRAPDGYFLGSWIAVQRRRYCGTAPKGEQPLTDRQIARLNALGMVWRVARGGRKHKVSPPPEPSGPQLPRVILRQGLSVEDAAKRIRELSQTACSGQEIADSLNLSRQRISQLIDRMPDGRDILVRLRENREAAKPKPEPKVSFVPSPEEIKQFVADAMTVSALRSKTPSGSPKWAARDRRDEVLARWYSEGMSIPGIAAATGINEHTLRKWRLQIKNKAKKEGE